MKKQTGLQDKGIWLNDGPSDMDDVPQEIKDWATGSSKLDDPFSREWYKLPVKHPRYAVKKMVRRIHGRDEINEHPVLHKRFPSASGGMFYYICQDPDTKAILWGKRED